MAPKSVNNINMPSNDQSGDESISASNTYRKQQQNNSAEAETNKEMMRNAILGCGPPKEVPK
jgi:hypothetical protein